jgi:hypothetical protein
VSGVADWNGEEIRMEQTAPNGREIAYEPKPKPGAG